MAYTITLAKQGISRDANGIYNISFSARVNDGTVDVIDTTVTGRHNPNAPDLEGTKSQVLNDLKAVWDKWAAENNVLTSAALDAAVAAMQTSAQTYITANS